MTQQQQQIVVESGPPCWYNADEARQAELVALVGEHGDHVWMRPADGSLHYCTGLAVALMPRMFSRERLEAARAAVTCTSVWHFTWPREPACTRCGEHG